MNKIVIKKKPKVMNKTITKKTPKKKVKRFYRIDEFELNDGDIQVYRTNFSGKFWTMSCWISEEQRMFVKSLRTKDKDTATGLAKKRYLEVQTLVISGQSVFDKSLGELCQMYLDDQKERIRIGHQEVGRGSTGITKGRWSAKQTQIKKHLLGFMDANTKISTIKSEHFKRK